MFIWINLRQGFESFASRGSKHYHDVTVFHQLKRHRFHIADIVKIQGNQSRMLFQTSRISCGESAGKGKIGTPLFEFLLLLLVLFNPHWPDGGITFSFTDVFDSFIQKNISSRLGDGDSAFEKTYLNIFHISSARTSLISFNNAQSLNWPETTLYT